ncbi:MAG: hypothetical protein QXV69_01405 [Sulfolobaceae archaeon]
MSIKKLILVSSESHPNHKYFKKILEELSIELNVEKEIKLEDYVFLSEYGEKDEFGMPFLPQLFAITSNNKILPILTQMPFNTTTLEPDPIKAKEDALNKIKNLES